MPHSPNVGELTTILLQYLGMGVSNLGILGLFRTIYFLDSEHRKDIGARINGL